MSKKWLFGLAVCTLAMGAFGCDSDDDGKSCKETPKIIEQSNKLNSAVTKDTGITITSTTIADNLELTVEDCQKYADNLAEYFNEDIEASKDNKKSLGEAWTDYKAGLGANGILDFFCSAANIVNAAIAVMVMKNDVLVGDKCVKVLAEDTVEASQEASKSASEKLSGSLGNLTTLEGWQSVTEKAAEEAQKQAEAK